NILRNKRPQPSNLANHRTAFNGIDPNRGPFDRGSRRFQLGKPITDRSDCDDQGRNIDQTADEAFPSRVLALNVHINDSLIELARVLPTRNLTAFLLEYTG